MENETMSGIALVVAIVAILGVVGTFGYAYLNQPGEVDLSDVIENSYDLSMLRNKVDNLQDDMDEIVVINPNDLEDLEDYANWFDNIEKNADDIDDLEDGITGEAGPTGPQGEVGPTGPVNEVVLNCLLEYASDEGIENATDRLPDLLTCLS